MTLRLSEAEIARRLPVWTALADLYLDTDAMLQVGHISRTIAESDFDISEVQAILRWEVRPAFYRNLLQIAGEWAGWHEDEVRCAVLTTDVGAVERILLGERRFMPRRKVWSAIVHAVRRLRPS